MSLSETVLKKLSKEEVIDLSLQYQNKFDSTLANVNKEISDLGQNYEKMQSELCVSGKVSSKLREQILLLEQPCWDICQNSRRECLEVSGLPESLKHSELEHAALKLFRKTDGRSSNIEEWHWLPGKGPKRAKSFSLSGFHEPSKFTGQDRLSL